MTKKSPKVAITINNLYAGLAQIAARNAKKCAENEDYDTTVIALRWVEEWANRAGANALRYGL